MRPTKDGKLTEKGAAKYLGIGLDRLRHEVNAGRLAFTGTNSRRRFDTAELMRWRRETKRAKRAMPVAPDLAGVPRSERRGVVTLENKHKRRAELEMAAFDALPGEVKASIRRYGFEGTPQLLVMLRLGEVSPAEFVMRHQREAQRLNTLPAAEAPIRSKPRRL
jgi:excisionase family DNA binding protein